MSPSDLATRAAAAVLIALGIALRARGLDHGWAPDEIANVHPGGALAILRDPEAAVNPPLARWLGNLAASDVGAISTGRWVSFVASCLTLPAAFALGCRASRSRLGALAALGTLAVAPVAVIMASQFRGYALWGLFATLHLLALSSRAEGVAGPRDDRLARWTAVALVWTHYLTLPLAALLAGALRRTGVDRDAWRLWVPAALSVLPMGLLVLSETGTRVASRAGPLDNLPPILSAGFQGAPGLQEMATALGPGPWSDWPLALPFAAAVAAGGLAWRRLTPTARVCLLSAGALAAAATGVGLVQFVRSPVGLMWLTFAAPCLGAGVAVARSAAGRVACATLLGLLWLPGLPHTLAAWDGASPEAAFQDAVTHWRQWDGPRGDGAIFLAQGYAFTGLHLAMTGLHVSARHRPNPPCDTGACYVHEGVTVRDLRDRRGAPGLVISFEAPPPPEQLAGCAPLEVGRFRHVWRCERALRP